MFNILAKMSYSMIWLSRIISSTFLLKALFWNISRKIRRWRLRFRTWHCKWTKWKWSWM